MVRCLVWIASVLGIAAGCASLRLAALDPLPAGEPVRGPHGSYEVVPPAEAWVRAPSNESERNVDLSLARKSNDAWLNVSVVRDRYSTAQLALERGRSRAESLMTVRTREEQDVSVPSPAGDLPGRLGVYCGTFDRELRARDSCLAILTTLWQRAAYVVVGQVRLQDPEPGRKDELLSFVTSLRIREPGPAAP